MQTYSFIYKLGGDSMSRNVDITELLDKIIEFNHNFSQVDKKLLSRQNLNASTINLISIIGDETMTLKQITEVSGLDKSTVSRQMNSLVKDGYVTRETGEDKRFSFFELSDDAKLLYRQFSTDFVEYLDNTLRGWSEEEKHMLSVLIGRANHSLSTTMSRL